MPEIVSGETTWRLVEIEAGLIKPLRKLADVETKLAPSVHADCRATCQ